MFFLFFKKKLIVQHPRPLNNRRDSPAEFHLINLRGNHRDNLLLNLLGDHRDNPLDNHHDNQQDSRRGNRPFSLHVILARNRRSSQ